MQVHAQPLEKPQFLLPEPGYAWSFPRDHANHPRYALEWWYYTGHLLPQGKDPSEAANWSHLQLTIFRSAVPGQASGQLYFGHLAISGPEMEFAYAERIARGTLGEAGSDDNVLDAWVDDWRVFAMPDGSHILEASADSVGGIRLRATPSIGPVLNGDRGFSRKGSAENEASLYYSMPWMNVEGWLYPSNSRSEGRRHGARQGGEREGEGSEGGPIPVSGSLWMDHEFGNQRLGEGLTGWDWWGLELPGGEALMLYRIRRADGSAIPESEATFTSSDGSTQRIPLSEIQVEVTGSWVSPHSGVSYPHGWVLRIPELVHPVTGRRGMVLTVTPVCDDQELKTDRSTRVTYYEGAVGVERSGYTEGSYGYVELVGYDAVQALGETRPLDVPEAKPERGD